MDNGLGNYGYIDNGQGGVIGIDQSAYSAINSAGGAGDLRYGTMGDNNGSMFNGDNLGLAFDGIQALGGLSNAYLGYKNYGLAKDQFNFSKAATNRDIANQGKLVNDDIMNRTDVGLSLAGNSMTDTQRTAERQNAKSKFVNTSAIG